MNRQRLPPHYQQQQQLQNNYVQFPTPNQAKGGFHENPNRLIRCVKNREKTLRKKLDSKKLTSIADLKVDRWFLTRFSIETPYAGLQEEFASLETGVSQWTQTSRVNSYIATPLGINAYRQLKVINAQKIGPLFGREYVASEGPTTSSVYDFWTLIWQEDIGRVLSVNFPYEERLYPSIYDQAKETIQYWPIVAGETMIFKPFHITCIESTMKVAPFVEAATPREMVYRVTRLRLFYQNPVFPDQPTRDILHFCYYRWPDGRLPIPWSNGDCHSETGLSLFDAANFELIATMPPGQPLLVHCHAVSEKFFLPFLTGLGRTGVFIAVDVAIRQLEQAQTVGIAGIVEKVRETRARSVMNPWQYTYINLLIAEKALQLGILPPNIGGYSSRVLIDRVWQEINDELNRQFSPVQMIASTTPPQQQQEDRPSGSK
ncbi:hypothetical protein WR25_02059 [Diploscapter pachys]|uniref:Tyrosine-protein phosphatase domain-containing protein n=1 Tax=Diploscapter pachys TaxID=2018661 RepID=A0A2A2LLA5_9BILA|nr:hypothetical protein WR25_02059 [Diploscapter pachys]